MICAKSPIFIKTTGIDRLQSEKSRSASSDMEEEDALRLVKLKKSSNIRKNCFKTAKEKPSTARSSARVFMVHPTGFEPVAF